MVYLTCLLVWLAVLSVCLEDYAVYGYISEISEAFVRKFSEVLLMEGNTDTGGDMDYQYNTGGASQSTEQGQTTEQSADPRAAQSDEELDPDLNSELKDAESKHSRKTLALSKEVDYRTAVEEDLSTKLAEIREKKIGLSEAELAEENVNSTEAATKAQRILNYDDLAAAKAKLAAYEMEHDLELRKI
jgi:hypothetical protein